MHDSADSIAVAPPSLPLRAWRWCVRWRYLLGLVAVVTVFALSSIPNARPPRVRGLDKVQHVVEYFLLGLVFLNIATRGLSNPRPVTVLGTWLAALGVALADETYQRWVPGRRFDLWDIFASATGITLAVLLALTLRLLWVRRRSP